MTDCAIYYFSGTGNSRAVALELASRLQCQAHDMTRGRPLDNEAPETLIYVFPVYGWRMPEVVRRFVVATAALHRCVMVATCGDDIGTTARSWRQLVALAGGTPEGAYSVAMPNTYVFLPGFDVDAPEVAHRKVKQMPDRVRYIAGAICRHADADDVVEGSYAWFKSNVLGWFFHHFMMSPSGFVVDPALCDRCRACVRVCPMKNISEGVDHLPRWGVNCSFCTGCYHVCPRHAISHGSFSGKKGQSLFAHYDKKS